jgi:hypothetical protein
MSLNMQTVKFMCYKRNLSSEVIQDMENWNTLGGDLGIDGKLILKQIIIFLVWIYSHNLQGQASGFCIRGFN